MFLKNIEQGQYRWLSNQRSYIKKSDLFLFFKTFTNPIRQIENLNFFELDCFMECYEPVNKGRICTDPLSND